MLKDNISNIAYASQNEHSNRDKLFQLFENSPIPKNQLLENIGLFLDSKNLARILYINSLFEQIIEVQGIVIEFGTRWGQNMALFEALRGIHDPFNRHRRIVAFDTFEGFPSIHEKDGKSKLMKEGQLSLTENYDQYLDSVLSTREALNPLSHIKKYEIRKGDGTVEFEKYLEENPHTIVALAYFDFDLYEPTKNCLELLMPRLTKGSIVAFDELNDPDSPGETLALMETMGLNNVRLKRPKDASRVSYLVIE
jgi:hypothetical protein